MQGCIQQLVASLFSHNSPVLIVIYQEEGLAMICAQGLEFCLRSTAKGQTQDQGCIFSIQGPTQTSKKLICCSISLLFSALPQIARQKFWIQPLYKSWKGFDTGIATQIQEFKSSAHQDTSVKKILIIFILRVLLTKILVGKNSRYDCKNGLIEVQNLIAIPSTLYYSDHSFTFYFETFRKSCTRI